MLGAVRGHDRLVLRRGGPHEDLLDVEGDGCRTLQPDPLGEALVEVDAVVEVGEGRQREELGPGPRHRVGEARAGHEADAVAAFGEPAGDREHRRHVPVDRNGRDEDG